MSNEDNIVALSLVKNDENDEKKETPLENLTSRVDGIIESGEELSDYLLLCIIDEKNGESGVSSYKIMSSSGYIPDNLYYIETARRALMNV